MCRHTSSAWGWHIERHELLAWRLMAQVHAGALLHAAAKGDNE